MGHSSLGEALEASVLSERPLELGCYLKGLVEAATREGRLSHTQPSGATEQGRREGKGREGTAC